MDAVIIIDKRQVVVHAVESMLTSWMDDVFTIRFETKIDEDPLGISDDDLLDRLIDDPQPSVVDPTVDTTAGRSWRSPLPHETTLKFGSGGDISVETSPVSTDGHSEDQSQSTRVRTPAAATTARARLVAEPGKASSGRATFGSSVAGVSRAVQDGRQNAPATQGIIMPDKDSTLVGQTFPLAADKVHILNKMRRDYDVRVIHESEIAKFKSLKPNKVLRSDTFKSMRDADVRLALQTLVIGEQDITRGTDRENLLYLDVHPALVIESIVDDVSGTGVFRFEETVSVYENPETYRTKVDNGKD